MTSQKSPPSRSDALGAMPTTTSAYYAERSPLLTKFDHFASRITRWAGSPAAFCAALLAVLIWGAVGPVFLGGVRYASDAFSVGFEIRYQKADGDLDPVNFVPPKIDLGGWNYQATFGLRFD